jgi:hypothetical protein
MAEKALVLMFREIREWEEKWTRYARKPNQRQPLSEEEFLEKLTKKYKVECAE